MRWLLTTGQPSKSVPKLHINTVLPEGEAVNPDGTLKDAADMDWVFSPSDENPSIATEKDAAIKRKTMEAENDRKKKTKVSHGM